MANVSGMSETCKVNENCKIDKEEVGTSENKDDNCNGESKSNDETGDTATTSNCQGVRTPAPSFCLRTSKLNPTSFGSLPSTPNKPFVLNPPRLSNPFAKPDKEDKSKPEESVCSTPKSSLKEDKQFTPFTKSSVSFLPLGGEASTPSQLSTFAAATTPSLGFVFGQNIHEKVEAATPAESSTVAAAEPSPSKESQEVTTNGTSSSESLFLSQVPKDSSSSEKTAEGSKSLSEAAREYEEARAVKRRYEEVPVLTGEEEESNVLQSGERIPKSEPMDVSSRCVNNVIDLIEDECPIIMTETYHEGKKRARVVPIKVRTFTDGASSSQDIQSFPTGDVHQSVPQHVNQNPFVEDSQEVMSSLSSRGSESSSTENVQEPLADIREPFVLPEIPRLFLPPVPVFSQSRQNTRPRLGGNIGQNFRGPISPPQMRIQNIAGPQIGVPPMNEYNRMLGGMNARPAPPPPQPPPNVRFPFLPLSVGRLPFPQGVFGRPSTGPIRLPQALQPPQGNAVRCTCGSPSRTRCPEDSIVHYGQYVVSKLRAMDCRQRVFAEKLITDVLCEGELGNLSGNCEVITGERMTSALDNIYSITNLLHSFLNSMQSFPEPGPSGTVRAPYHAEISPAPFPQYGPPRHPPNGGL